MSQIPVDTPQPAASEIPAASASATVVGDKIVDANLKKDQLRATGAAAQSPVVQSCGPANVVEHVPVVQKEVIPERPVQVVHEHHVQPIVHERVHQVQPVIQKEVTIEEKVVETDRNVMLPPVEAPANAAAVNPPTGLAQPPQPVPTQPVPGGGIGEQHASLGQKLRGTMKEVAGTVTRNPAKKEEGRLLKHGIDPTKNTMV
jgi:hypothetical protein